MSFKKPVFYPIALRDIDKPMSFIVDFLNMSAYEAAQCITHLPPILSQYWRESDYGESKPVRRKILKRDALTRFIYIDYMINELSIKDFYDFFLTEEQSMSVIYGFEDGSDIPYYPIPKC